MRFRLPIVILLGVVLLAMIGIPAQIGSAQIPAQTPPPSSILFENVRIFNGTASQLSAPSSVLVEGNKIKTISQTSIAASGAGLTCCWSTAIRCKISS